MGRDWEDYDEDDEFCLGCGEHHYSPSRTPGLCKACADPTIKDEWVERSNESD